MKVVYPKKASEKLIKKTRRALQAIQEGQARFRKTERHGYRTLALGRFERVVLIDDVLHVFAQHSNYEKFVNAQH